MFIGWLAEKTPVLGSPSLEEVSEDSQCFLLPEFEGRALAEQWVMQRWRFFLEQQLLEWVPNRRRWPKNRHRQLFTQWFTPEIHELVWDLVEVTQSKQITTLVTHLTH